MDEVGQASAFARLNSQLFGGGEREPTLGRYVLHERIGRGGMGVVHRAHDPELGRDVAIKLLRDPKSELAESLIDEGRALARLTHPNIVSVYDVGRCEVGEDASDGVYIVMELIQGESVSKWLGRPRGWREVVAAFLQAGAGLAAAHAAGIVHGDFKPANVVVADDGRVMVLDFGLAVLHAGAGTTDRSGVVAATSSERSAEPRFAGTPLYMAPEAHEGDATYGSDQYSFCVSLFEALSGEVPFVGPLQGLLNRKLEGPPPPPKHAAPRRIWAAIRRGLSPRPADRFRTVDELLAALRPPRRWPLVAGFALLVAGATGLALGTTLGPDDPLSCDRSGEALIAESLTPQARSGLAERAHHSEGGRAGLGRLDAYVGAWQDVRREVCAAADPTTQAAAVACLEQRRRQLEGTVAVLLDPGTPLDRADVAVARLAPPDDCRAAPKKSLEGVDAAALARAESLRATGRLGDALDLARTGLADAAGDRAAAQWGILLGGLHAELGHADEAESSLREAWVAAERAADRELVLASTLRLASQLPRAKYDEALSLVELARARAGERLPGAVAWLFPTVEARLAFQRGDVEGALVHYDDALQAYDAAPTTLQNGFDDIRLSKSIVEMLVGLGRGDEALARGESLVVLVRRRFGDRHPQTVAAALAAGRAASMAGRTRRALALFQLVSAPAAELEDRSQSFQIQRFIADALVDGGDAVAAAAELDALQSGPRWDAAGQEWQLHVLLAKAQTSLSAGRLTVAATALGQAASRLREPGMLRRPANFDLTLTLAFFVAQALEDYPTALAVARLRLQRERLNGSAMALPTLADNAIIEAIAGDRERAVELLQQAETRAFADEAGSLIRAWASLAVAEAHWRLGQAERAVEIANSAAELFRRYAPDQRLRVAEALIVRARAELSRDMPAAAAASAQSSLDALGDEPLRHITEVKVLALLAEIHEQRGDREAEADVRRTLRTRCKALGAAGPPCGPGEPEARATVAQVSKMLLELQPPG